MKKHMLTVIPLMGFVMIFYIYNRSIYEYIIPTTTTQGMDSELAQQSLERIQKVHQRKPQAVADLDPQFIPKSKLKLNTKKTNTNFAHTRTIQTTKPPRAKLQPVDDIDWVYLRTMPTYNQSEDVLQSEWWKAAAFLEIDFNKRPRDYKCRKLRRMGNWYLCQDKPYRIEKPCLVYSFGIANDFSFDDDMAKLGCEVHSFDPSMNAEEHVRNTSVTFHPIGLSDKVIQDFNPRHDIYVTNDQKWNMMDLLTIMDKLGHKNRVLDYLKIDVEGHEWAVLDYLITTGISSRIRHFSLEYHIFPDWPSKAMYPDLLRTYKNLKEMGFYKYFTGLHPLNHTPRRFNIQADVCYVNKKFKA